MASNGLVVENMLGFNAAAFKCNRTGTKLNLAQLQGMVNVTMSKVAEVAYCSF